MTQEQQVALKLLTEAYDRCKANGINIVSVASIYGNENNTHFSTRVSVKPCPEVGVDATHIVMDAIRDISMNWHNETHRSQIKFVMPPQERDAHDLEEDATRRAACEEIILVNRTMKAMMNKTYASLSRKCSL
jgi:hypothetical protein